MANRATCLGIVQLLCLILLSPRLYSLVVSSSIICRSSLVLRRQLPVSPRLLCTVRLCNHLCLMVACTVMFLHLHNLRILDFAVRFPVNLVIIVAQIGWAVARVNHRARTTSDCPSTPRVLVVVAPTRKTAVTCSRRLWEFLMFL